MKNIRNFCIIAHIDHGKSTLADRLLEYTKTVEGKDMQAQVLDDMDLERERGITIKSHAIQMKYNYKGEEYILNLIDTPGHVDFSYEVSRSIAACEGALLIVDAAQGIQAQTISNLYMAIENDLEIIPVMNKIDLPSAMPEEVEDQIVELLGCPREDILRASGKTGEGVTEILNTIVEKVPAPKGDPEAPLQCLIFDSVFNPFRGIIAYFKVVNGVIRKGDHVKFIATGKEYDADEVGILKLDMCPREEIRTGDVGYIISGIKTSREVRVGDTITHVSRPAKDAIAGFEEVKPMVFAGVYPIDSEDFENLRASLEKLQLNDASLTFQPESSAALGFGFRCGFLGLLHMEIVQERLDREFNMDVITTVPNVSYIVHTKKGEEIEVHNPGGLPDPTLIDHIDEPFIRASVITNTTYIGPIMTLCLGKRGILLKREYIFNVPWEMKAKDGTVKNVLRQASKGLLPDEILFRKKSPYPKTYHPAYEALLCERLKDVLSSANEPLLQLVDKEKVLLFLDHPKDYGTPWYGQLMAGPQMTAYLLQINYWLKKYQVTILL